MRRGSLNLIEVHIEKVVLALCGAFAAYLVVIYLVGSPNQVEYGGEPVGPDQLDEKILASAKELENRIDRAMDRYEEKPVANTSDELIEQFRKGVLDDQPEGKPTVPSALRASAPWGEPLPPEATVADGSRGSVELVTPLAPTRPVLRTGRSRVALATYTLSPEGATETAPTDEDEQTVDKSWVTVAAYWDFAAQRAANLKAGYLSYRARPYFVGTSVERQELLPTGEWSEWREVNPGSAMPRVEIPRPEYDELTGRVVNKAEIDALFAEVKEEQLELAQPRFLEVVRGDDWFVPPLEGFTEADRKAELAQRERDEQSAAQAVAAARPDPRNPSTRRPGGRNAPTRTGNRYGPVGGRDDLARPPTREPTTGKKDVRKEAQRDFADAKTAFLEQRYEEAEALARSIVENEQVKGGVKNASKTLLERITTRRELVEFNGLVRGGSLREDDLTVVTHPGADQDLTYAVWFHDDTVEPGKTYRYRLRVNLWNRYVSRPKELANPEDATRVVLGGEWSAPTDPVTTTPATQFFVTRGRPDQQTVQVDVWKWHDGWWVSEDFEVAPGDEIGGVAMIQTEELDEDDRPVRAEVDFSTGAVVLDVRFDEPTQVRLDAGRAGFKYVSKETTVLVYRDPSDGRARERDQLTDSYDEHYKLLKSWYQ